MSTAKTTNPSSSTLQEIDLLKLPVGSRLDVTTTSGSIYHIILLDSKEAHIEGGSYLPEGGSTARVRVDTAIIHTGARMYFEVYGLKDGFRSSKVVTITLVSN